MSAGTVTTAARSVSRPGPDPRRVALLSVASNSVLTVVKLVIGLVTGSVAVISEAAHSASDLMASVITVGAVRTAAKPADREHPYGHERAENLAAVVEGALVVAAGLVVAVEALRRLAGGGTVDHIGLAMGVMAGSALVNLVVSARLRRAAERSGSPALEGDALHLAADVWTCAGVFTGLGVVALTDWAAADAIAALAVAAYITVVGGRLVWRSADVLVDRTLPEEELAALERILDELSVDGVSFHKLRARRAGAKRHVDLHMVVPPDTTVREGHRMSGRVKAELARALPNVDALIHLEDR